MDFVRIKHKDVEGTGTVSVRAFGHLSKRGWELADTQPAPASPNGGHEELQRPQKNDSTEAWRTYAIARQMPEEQAADLGRDELVAFYAHLDQTQES